MERMAIFVEGQTERVFVEKLIREMAGPRHVHIDAVHAIGGGRLIPRNWVEIHAVRPDPSTEYYILIYESMNDARVLSDIREQYATLIDQGYRRIIGLRDVYPNPIIDVPTIRADFSALVPPGPVIPQLVLEVMEIEAWFIGEHTHFPRMHEALVPAVVTDALGYDPAIHDITTIAWPCGDLRRAYGVAHLSYNKSRAHVERTVNELSYEEVYLHLRHRLSDLDSLITAFEVFFA